MSADVLRMLVTAMTVVVSVLLLLAMLLVLALLMMVLMRMPMMVTAAMVAKTSWPSRCSCEIIRLVPLGSSNGGTRLPEVTEIAS